MMTGKEALIALANGEDAECCVTKRDSGLSEYWFSAKTLTIDEIEGEETEGNPDGTGICRIRFRLKPRTITINGIEVPAPFEPKKGEKYFYLTDEYDGGYGVHNHDDCTIEIAAWRTEEEIKQVVAALRQIFK